MGQILKLVILTGILKIGPEMAKLHQKVTKISEHLGKSHQVSKLTFFNTHVSFFLSTAENSYLGEICLLISQCSKMV